MHQKNIKRNNPEMDQTNKISEGKNRKFESEELELQFKKRQLQIKLAELEEIHFDTRCLCYLQHQEIEGTKQILREKF